MRADLVGILEASYRVEQPEPAWLDGVLDALGPGLDRGLGVTAFFYDASDVTRLRIRGVRGRGADEKGMMAAAAMEKSPPHRVAWTFRTAACGLASEGPDWATTPARQVFRGWGIEDVLFLNAVEPGGLGCFVTAPMRTPAKLTQPARRRWERVAAHLAAGYRLLRPRAAEPAMDAVLAPDGTLEDATEEAADRATRDRQVLGFVALGHANKFVAYELGIAPPTVSVLLMRAARKLRAGSRAELIAKFLALREHSGTR